MFMCEPEMLVWVCVCVCVSGMSSCCDQKGGCFFPLMLTRVSLDHLEGVINVTRAEMLSTSRRPRGGFMLEDVVKTKVLIFCFFVFFEVLLSECRTC